MHFPLLFSIFLALGAASDQIQSDPCGLERANTIYSNQRKFTFDTLGSDYDNIRVSLMNWGKWDFRWLVEHPHERKIMEKNYQHILSDIRNETFDPRFPSQNWTSGVFICIMDCNGFDVSQALYPSVNDFFLKFLVALQQIHAQFAYGFIVNANPIVTQLISVGRPVAGNFISKLEVHGTNIKKWLPYVLKKIPLDALPPSLGGKKDFKPIASCNLI